MLRVLATWALIILFFSLLLGIVVERTPYLRCQSSTAPAAVTGNSDLCAEPSLQSQININKR